MTTLTDRIANAACHYLDDRRGQAILGRDGEWRNHDVRDAFLRALADITVVADEAARQVTSIAPPTRAGAVWAYAGGDALRAAARRVGVAVTVRRTDARTFVLTID